MRHVLLFPVVVVAMLGLNCSGVDPAASRPAGPVAPTDGDGGGASNVTPGAPEFQSVPAAGTTVALSAVVGGTNTTSLAVTNSGEEDLTVTPSGLSGAIAVTPVPVQAIGARASLAYTIACSPTSVGTQTQTLVLATNDADEATNRYTVACTGTAAPTPEFESTPVAGSTIAITTTMGTSATAILTASNTGTANLTAAPSGLSGVLSVSPSTPQTIGVAASRDFTITCSPASASTSTQMLTLTTNDADEGTNTYTVQCTGTTPWPGPGCYYSSVYSLYIVWNGNQTQTPIDLTYDGTCATPPHTGVGGFLMVSAANPAAAASICTGSGYTFIDEISSSADTKAWPIYRCQI